MNDDYIISETNGVLNELEVHITNLIVDTNSFDKKSHLLEENILNKIMKVTANEVLFADNLNIYKMQRDNEYDYYDAQQVDLKSKREKKSMFFIDNDEDPYNGEMILFEKTSQNKFELSKIKCSISTTNKSLSQGPKQGKQLHIFVKRNTTDQNQLTHEGISPGADCVIEPLHVKSEF